MLKVEESILHGGEQWDLGASRKGTVYCCAKEKAENGS